MSLDKTIARKERVREKNRQLRLAGVVQLTEPGPWYSIPAKAQFDPSFFKGMIEQETAIDINPAK